MKDKNKYRVRYAVYTLLMVLATISYAIISGFILWFAYTEWNSLLIIPFLVITLFYCVILDSLRGVK